jgi:hypothetical protein
MEKKEAIRRLVFIRYLYNMGAEQTQKPDPYSWVSLLTFHNTVELFLVLVAEYLDIPVSSLRDIRFMRYWDLIDPILKEREKEGLTQKISMEKLNEARVAFKHHGTPPSADTISTAKINVGNFLEENAALVFEIKFSEISLIDLIESKKVKNNMKDARRFLNDGKDEEAVDLIAVAFRHLIDDYIDRKRDWYGRSVFDFGNFTGFSSSEELLSDVELAFDDVEDALDKLEEPMKMIALGLNYRKYARFKLLTAREIIRTEEGYETRRLGRKQEGELTKENVEFCMDFVIECAIILKEFDFELKPKKQRTLGDLI